MTKRISINITVLILSSVFTLFLAEKTLQVLGFNTYYAERFNPNSKIYIDNIEFKYSFTTNSDGLREIEIDKNKSNNEFRILFLGDSFTEGHGVENEARYSNKLRGLIKLQKPKKLTTINAGIGATGPTEYARMLSQIGLNYSPDLILIALHANDIQDVKVPFQEKLITQKHHPSYIADRGLKTKIKQLFPRIYRIYKQTIPRIRRARFFQRIKFEAKRRNIPNTTYERWKTNINEETANNIDLFKISEPIYTMGLFRPLYFIESLDLSHSQEKLVSLLKTLKYMKTISKNIPVAIIYLPCNFQHVKQSHSISNPWVSTFTLTNSEWLNKESLLESNLREFSLTNKIPYLSLTEALRQADKDSKTTNYPIDGHLNEIGHQVVAVELKKFICKLIPCQND